MGLPEKFSIQTNPDKDIINLKHSLRKCYTWFLLCVCVYIYIYIYLYLSQIRVNTAICMHHIDANIIKKI